MNPAWALLRLASPQLPIGGYSYSQGLEMAVENGRVNDPDSARRWISDQLLLNLARFEAPLLLAHCRRRPRKTGAPCCSVRRPPRQPRNPRAASGEPADGLLAATTAQRLAGTRRTGPPFSNNAPNRIWPSAGRWPLAPGRSAADALAAWLWSWLENQLAVLMKTLPLGQQAAQRLTSELLPLLQQAQQDATASTRTLSAAPRSACPWRAWPMSASTAACSVPRRST
jgi:urease accessory protein